MQSKAVKIGLIGLGQMGSNHLRILSMLKSVELEFIYDIDNKKMQKMADEHNTNPCYSLKEQLAENNLDAVVICSPTSTHVDYIKLVSNHVKNIFVEKPMASTVEEANKVLNIVIEKQINLQVGFIERFNPVVDRLKRVLNASGNIINIDFTRTNKLSERITDVDVITDLMIHDIDLALYLNGSADSISAHGFVENNMVSFASVTIYHSKDVLSRIQASRITEKKIRRIEATCKDAFIDCELLRKELIVNKQSELITKEGRGYRINSVQENIEVKQQEALLLEIQSFIDSCRGQYSDINPTAHDALNAIKLCAEIQKEIYSK